MLYVYGVVHAGTVLPDAPGVGRQESRPYLLEEAALAAVVSKLDDSAELTEDDAVTHLDLLAAITATDTVLPLRFGTTATDAEAVRGEVLTAAAAVWRDRLSALEGLVELRVDFGFDEQHALREAASRQPQLRELGGQGAQLQDRVRLGEAVAQAIRHWTHERGEQLVAPLAGHARRVVALDGGEPNESRWAMLVPRERVGEVDLAMRGLDVDPSNVQVRYVGPLPAYDFTEEVATEATAGGGWGW